MIVCHSIVYVSEYNIKLKIEKCRFIKMFPEHQKSNISPSTLQNHNSRKNN